MSNNKILIDRRSYLRTTGAAALGTATVAGCLGDATGTFATHVTDQPGDIDDFESCVVTIDGIWLGPEGADDGSDEDGDAEAAEEDDEDSSEDDSDREYHEFDEPQEADLVNLQDDSTQLVDERKLETAEYAFLQLDVDGVDATLTDGSDATVETPGEAPLKFDEAFEIREGTRTSFTADFTPVSRGRADSYVLQPVADGVDVTYDDAESDEE